MTLLQQRSKDFSADLSKYVSRLKENPTQKGIHRLRTTIRRTETLVNYAGPKLGKKLEKALEELRMLRKRAGKVRDLDIQIGLLGAIGNRSASADRRALLDALKKKRARQAERLKAAVNKLEGSKFLNRLERITEKASESVPQNGPDPLQVAQKELAEVANEFSTTLALKPSRLHDLRIKLKLLRYRAELAEETPEQQELIERLRSVQDAIGEWHDWGMLAEGAEKQFGNRVSCALLAEIRSLFTARFSAATSAALNLLATCVPPGKKKPSSVQPSGAFAQRA